jgi:HK97 gp10 family phage protein
MNLNQLQEAFKDITPQAKAELKAAMTKAALLVERDAKINAPVDSGTLRNSITHKIIEDRNLYSAEVGASVDYSDFQEYGTGQRGASSGTIPPSDYEFGSSRGIPAHPFLAPAFFKNSTKIKQIISQAIKKALER